MALKKGKRVEELASYPVAASTSIADGDTVIINSAGYAVPSSDLAGNKGAVGRAVGAVDNSAGANGDKEVVVETGVMRFTGAGFAQSDVNTTAYASGAKTAAPTQTGTNFAPLGLVRRFYSATEVDVKLTPEATAYAAS